MPSGLRFFGTNFAAFEFGGSITASSNVANEEFAFDGFLNTKWISSGEGTDGNQITLERDFGLERTIDAFYVYDHNINDIEVQYWDGAVWITATSANATIIKSADFKYLFVKLNNSVNTEKIRLSGEDTITANQEKAVTQFITFAEIGQFSYFPGFKPRFNPKQNIFTLTDGRGFVIERGEAFSASIEFKSHVNQLDINVADLLIARKTPFYIWPGGGNTSIFTFSFAPYRFKDIFKVALIGSRQPMLTKNYYKAGYNDKLTIIETT